MSKIDLAMDIWGGENPLLSPPTHRRLMRLAPRHPTSAPPQPEPESSEPDRPRGCRARPRPPRSRAGSGSRSRQPSDEELRRSARAFARRSRAAQGLPPHVQDPEVIAKLVVLFRPTTNPDDAQVKREGKGS
jgi:hypothetical protein